MALSWPIWVDVRQLPVECFFYVIHAWHEDAQPKTSTIFVVLEPRAEMNEAQYERLYRSCNAHIKDANDAQGVVVAKASRVLQNSLERGIAPGMTVRWFGRNSSRCFHVRPATHGELEELREAGCFDGKTLAPVCFVHALFHIDRVTTTLDGCLVLLEAGPQWTVGGLPQRVAGLRAS